MGYVQEPDRSVFIRVPSNLSLETLEVRTLTDGLTVEEWELRRAFLDSQFNQRVFRVERDPELDMVRVVSGDGVYGMSFFGQETSPERAIALSFMVNSGDVVFDRTKLEIKKAQISGVEYKQELTLGVALIEERGSKPTYRDWETDRKSTRLNSSHRSLSRMPSSA